MCIPAMDIDSFTGYSKLKHKHNLYDIKQIKSCNKIEVRSGTYILFKNYE